VAERHSLADIIRKMCQDTARLRLTDIAPAALTDGSGGVAAAAYADAAIPRLAYGAAGGNAADTTSTATALASVYAALIALAAGINATRTALGLNAVKFTGAPAEAGKIPAVITAVTATSGANAVDFATGSVAMIAAKADVRAIQDAVNEIAAAVGADPTADQSQVGSYQWSPEPEIDPALAVVAATDPAFSLSQADVQAFLAGCAANIATAAAAFNAIAASAATPQPLQVVAKYEVPNTMGV